MRTACGICLATAALAGLLLALPGPARSAGDDEGGPVHVFNGISYYTWLTAPSPGAKPYGKNHDPEKVFTVHDGVLRVSGKVLGGLVTEKEYENYHLTAEYKWGEKTWPPREDKARDSGIMLHCTGADGCAPGGAWMECIECQMIEGGTGDFILVPDRDGHHPAVTATAVQKPVGREGTRKEWYYEPGAPPQPISAGRIDWRFRDPLWKDVKGFRGSREAEKPHYDWNKLECIC
ncbi:MAG TPA: DUF1080 domain-containing protein, partial [Gemmataceae bacterium]|nr:DUF1080 domain-containing protein [Gemmataceae bacterium]